jgi:predicted Ser/Thr protein kinase
MSGKLSLEAQKKIEACLQSSIPKMDYELYKRVLRTPVDKISTFTWSKQGLFYRISDKKEFPRYDPTRDFEEDFELLKKVIALLQKVEVVVSSDHMKLLLTEEEAIVLDMFIDLSSFDQEPFEKIMGCVFGKFPFPIDFLGQGQFGTVFLIKYEGTFRALKISSSDQEGISTHTLEWNNECKLAKKVGEIGLGPKILECQICDRTSHDPDNRGYMLQEYIYGKTLEETKLTKELIFKVLTSYEALLTAGIVHQDAHAGNIIISKAYLADGKDEPEVRWIDFGLSSEVKNEAELLGAMNYYAVGLQIYIKDLIGMKESFWVKTWITSHPKYVKKYDEWMASSMGVLEFGPSKK